MGWISPAGAGVDDLNLQSDDARSPRTSCNVVSVAVASRPIDEHRVANTLWRQHVRHDLVRHDIETTAFQLIEV
jgi:hypothetical protein